MAINPLIDVTWVRQEIIAAVAAEPVLGQMLVLKGGNALSLVHRIGMRASLDIDYSVSGGVKDPALLSAKLFAALRDRFATQGLVIFDERLERRPRVSLPGTDPLWGGYAAEFKLIPATLWQQVAGDAQRRRKAAVPVASNVQSGRRFRIEISLNEYCVGARQVAVLGGASVLAYSPGMIAAEKLRSLCQQMPEYGLRAHPAPRARDFHDLHALVTEGGVDFSAEAFHGTVKEVFAVKRVPIELLPAIGGQREFHRPDWPAVLNAMAIGRVRDFDFYVDFVAAEIRSLKPLWMENSP